MSKTDIEEVAFDAANHIKRMISETAPKDSVQLGEFILSVITEALVDTVTASCEQLVEENALMRAAIDQTIAWQESVDSGNTESVRPLLDIETPLTASAGVNLALKLLAEHHLKEHAEGVTKLIAERIRYVCGGGM